MVRSAGVHRLGVQESLERLAVLRLVFDGMTDAVVVTGADGIIDSSNRSAQSMFGYDADTMIGLHITRLLPGCQVPAPALPEARANPRSRRTSLPTRVTAIACTAGGAELPVIVHFRPISAGERELIAAFVHDASDRPRNELLFRFVNEISRMLLSGQGPWQTLGHTALRARQLTDSSDALVVVPDTDTSMLVLATSGTAAMQIFGETFPSARTISQRAMTTGVTIPIDDMSTDSDVVNPIRNLGLGPGLYVPIRTVQREIGTLVLARSKSSPAYDERGIARAQIFASAIGVVNSLARSRQELEEMRDSAARDRIAHDLHRSVIHPLFSLGINLEGMAHGNSESVAEQIDHAVTEIDRVIREIRDAVFDR